MRRTTLICFLVALFLFSCSSDKDNKGSKNDGNSLQKKNGGTVVSAISSDIDSWNTLFSQQSHGEELRRFLFLKTLTYNENLKIRGSDFRPCLAHSWRFSEDFLNVTLYLQENLRWSDGVPITAHDVLFTYQKMIDPVIGYPHFSRFDFVDTCRVINDYEIKFHFKEVYANELDHINFEVLPKHVFDRVSSEEMRDHPFNENPSVVSGPYRLKRWERGQLIEFEKNPEYGFSKPHIDRFIFRVIPNQISRLTSLKTGSVQLVQSVSPEQVESLQKDNPNLNMLIYPSLSYEYIGWLHDHPLFKDRRIRRAMTMGINRRQIVDALFHGYARECIGPVHPARKDFYNSRLKPLPYDPEQAKSLLAEAGWTDGNDDGILDKEGKNLSFVLKTNINSQLRIDAATMIQADLKKIGVKAVLEIVEFNVMIAQQTARDYEALISGWSMNITFDPTDIWHSKSIASGYNEHNYANAAVDSLIDLGRRTLDKDKSRHIWYRFQEVLYEDQPYTFLYVKDHVDAIDNRIKGVKTWPKGVYYNMEEWWIEEP